MHLPSKKTRPDRGWVAILIQKRQPRGDENLGEADLAQNYMIKRHSTSERPKRNITWQGPWLAVEPETRDGRAHDRSGVASERNVQWGLATKVEPKSKHSAELILSLQ